MPWAPVRAQGDSMRISVVLILLAVLLLPAVLALAVDVPKDVNVDIDVHKGGGQVWYKNPIIIGLGVVVLVLIAILAGRGGGTTIVERR
jgi:hypothetical protein